MKQHPNADAMTKTDQASPTKRRRHLRVPVFPEEGQSIDTAAKAAGLSTADYLRRLGLGHRPPSRLDNQRLETLFKINADLGRLGGLLKLWLTDDKKAGQLSPRHIRAVLHKIEANQDAIKAQVEKLLKPRSAP